jgi:glutamate 5-kinase
LLDEGAERAILYNGKSLLLQASLPLEGDFSRGDCIEIAGRSGNIIARGITNYPSSDINMIKGLKVLI